VRSSGERIRQTSTRSSAHGRQDRSALPDRLEQTLEALLFGAPLAMSARVLGEAPADDDRAAHTRHRLRPSGLSIAYITANVTAHVAAYITANVTANIDSIVIA
jgi:hypothetical protein